MRYRSKPSEIEAVQWTGDNYHPDITRFLPGDLHYVDRNSVLFIKAGKDGAQDYVPVPVGHWIVHPPGDLTDIWPVDPDYFTAKYEPVPSTDVDGEHGA